MQRVACVIPAYDAARTLASVIRGLRAAVPDALTVVVNDGSRDDTGAAADQWSDCAVHLAHNRGKGAALRAGFEIALGVGATAILTIDADGQHDPACAPRLLAALADADVVALHSVTPGRYRAAPPDLDQPELLLVARRRR